MVSNDNSGTEQITFNVYNASTDSIYNCNEGLLFYDDPDSCSCKTSLDLTIPSPNHTWEYDLIEDWNWVSFGLVPSNTSVPSVFSDLTAGNDIYQIKNQSQSSTYLAGTWTGDLGSINIYDGYLINMINAYPDFTFTGEPVNPIINSISLTGGWKWISYIPLEAKPVSEALASIGGSAQTIKGQTKSACFSGGWFGDLTELEPQKSYKIYVNTPAILTYPANSCTNTKSDYSITKNNPANWKLISGTNKNMITIADVKVNNELLSTSSNYALGVFDKQGNCKSIGVRTNNIWYFTIVGNTDNNELQFVLYDENEKKEYYSKELIKFENDAIKGSLDNPITINFAADNSFNNPRLYNATPNPFNNSTTLSFSIPNEQQVKLDIYNILGQHIATIYDGTANSGTNDITWNGTDNNNNPVPNGIYFYKITSGDYTKTEKMIKLQ